ncbi:MAG: tetratricopeptide repeat protein [Kiritimatiellae bacterium]|nr:tetratricopeptide repeat protein [Verrucomicrobiota bacterium]MCG2659705.1 tetratricopeptide repeat protein [Kiritimatiellia bacterium]
MSPNQEESQSDDVAQWKSEERRELWSRLIRWGVGVPLVLFSYPWLGWFGPFLVVLGSILIARDIAGYFATKFAGNIIWTHHDGKPKPIYGIPRSLAAKGRYAEAEKEYENIIQEFPNEVKPHIEMINIAIVRLNDAELAEQLYQRGMGLLQDPDDREMLTRMYAAIRTRLKRRDKYNRKPVPLEKLEKKGSIRA